MGSAPEAFLAPYAKRAKAVVGGRAKVFVAGRVLDLATAERVPPTVPPTWRRWCAPTSPTRSW